MSTTGELMSYGGAYQLCPCTAEDEAFARIVHRAAYEDVVTRQFGRWDQEEQRGSFEAKWDPAAYSVVVVNGARVGVTRHRRESDRIELDEIQLLPAAQGKGIGTAIIHDLQSLAADAGIPLRLQVLRLNRARGLYERLGFLVVGETEHHYQMEWATDE